MSIPKEHLPISAASQDDPDTYTAADEEEILEVEPEPAPISYSGTDFDVEGLVRRLQRGDIVVPTFGHGDDTMETAGFQRGFVWRKPQMDRFIESLLLGYPIPGIILVQQTDRRYLVLDGQQRLTTLRYFYEGIYAGRVFRLDNVARKFSGLTYSTLDPELRRQLNNTFIQATIVRTDNSTESLDSVYQVFERLNSGGTQLTPHEIRIALYAGPCVEWLSTLNEIPAWRDLYGPTSPRLRDQELVLRCIALYVTATTYRRPLKKFLNDFLGEHRDLDSLPAELISKRFHDATKVLLEGPGRRALRYQSNQVNAALAEALVVGLMRRLDADPMPSSARVSDVVDELNGDKEFTSVISRATADEEAVRKRLSIATSRLAST